MPPISAEEQKRRVEDWRDTLVKKLVERRARIALLENYYEGNHPLPGPPDTMQRFQAAVQAYTLLSRMGVTNFVKKVADAPASRLRVTGFRFGEETKGDADVWRIWQRNQLDADAGVLHHAAITTGQAFELVWPGDDGADITVEHPAQAIVAYQPGSRRRRAAGLKLWEEDDESLRAVLYLPGEVYKWQTSTDVEGITPNWTQWQPDTDDTWPIDNPFDEVPLIEFRASPSLKPALYGGGRSDLDAVLSIQDRINKTNFDRLVTAEFQAFRQRWATGWTPDDPNQAMEASVKRMLAFADPDVTVGEFAQADFTPFLKAVEQDVHAMATITSTPVFYMLSQVSNISGDTLSAFQTSFVERCEAHRDNFGESHEEVMRLALKAQNDDRANDQQSMMIWADIEHRTWAETADALVKMKALGVPTEALWTMLPNVTPQDIERWRIMVADEALFAPQPPTPAPLRVVRGPNGAVERVESADAV